MMPTAPCLVKASACLRCGAWRTLCAGRSFLRKQLAFPEDLQRASREHPAFAWVASPALLKRMGDNLDWPALSAVRRVFSSGGALPAEHQRGTGGQEREDFFVRESFALDLGFD